MRLRLTNGYPYPFPENPPDDDPLMLDGNLVLHGVRHFEWKHTVTVEFENWYYLEKATDATGWKSWDNGLVLEAPQSAADGYGHPAIIVKDVAYCGFILEDE